ncbi:hypothetical protein [Marinobacter zhejiangensis]|nr:hypothetical protein [Marinobacter zhejiangensis]
MELSGNQPETDQPACNLAHEPCTWDVDGSHWQASLTQLPDEQGSARFRFSIKTNATIERMHGVLRGESMYLGEYPVLLTYSDSEQEWQGVFTPPVCTVQDIMVWRIDLELPGRPALNAGQRLLFEVHRK